MTVVELFLRLTAALVLGDPASGALPLVAVAALGVTVVSVALLVAHVLTLVLGLTGGRPLRADRAPVDLATRIAWSHPDADGHARPRAPGALHQA